MRGSRSGKSTASRGRGNGSSSPSGKPRTGRRGSESNDLPKGKAGQPAFLFFFVRGVKPAGVSHGETLYNGKDGKTDEARGDLRGDRVHRFRADPAASAPPGGQDLRPHLGAVLLAVARAGVPSVQGKTCRRLLREDGATSVRGVRRRLPRTTAHLVVRGRGTAPVQGYSCDRPVG